jgi:hypothetical protein
MRGARGSNFDIALLPADKTSRLLQSVICDSHDLWPIGTNVAITKQKNDIEYEHQKRNYGKYGLQCQTSNSGSTLISTTSLASWVFSTPELICTSNPGTAC